MGFGTRYRIVNDARWVRTARPVASLRQGRNDWYKIKNSAPNSAEVYIYDEIGYWGVTAQMLIDELQALQVSTIELHLNTPGGEVFDGIAIHNALKNHPATINVTVDALAASIGTIIAMAGDTITMAAGSQMMIHEASAFCAGNAVDMRTLADLLDKVSDNLADFYAARAGGTREEWRARMLAETWYLAGEAVEAGLADKVVGAPDPAAQDALANWDLSIYRYNGRALAPAPEIPAQATVGVPPVPDATNETPDPFQFDPEEFRRAVREAVSA